MTHLMIAPAAVAAMILVSACETPRVDMSGLDSVRTMASDAKSTADRAIAASNNAATRAERAAAAAERAAAAAERAAASAQAANQRADNMFRTQQRK